MNPPRIPRQPYREVTWPVYASIVLFLILVAWGFFHGGRP
jgi:hypothetical protein